MTGKRPIDRVQLSLYHSLKKNFSQFLRNNLEARCVRVNPNANDMPYRKVQSKIIVYVLTCFVLFTLLWPASLPGQSTLDVNFNGQPDQVPGSQILVQQYIEQGMYFRALPNTDGFARVWTGMPPEWPNNGTPYLQATLGDSLVFNVADGASFGLASVDLAAFTTGLPSYAVTFVGYRPNGSTITANFSGHGTDFQTYHFDPDWSSDLVKVEIPNDGWSLDNLVVAVPEPGSFAFLTLGAAILAFKRFMTQRTLCS